MSNDPQPTPSTLSPSERAAAAKLRYETALRLYQERADQRFVARLKADAARVLRNTPGGPNEQV